MKKLVMGAVFFCVIQTFAADLKYDFDYSLQGDIRGKFLLIIPYRVFIEVSGSVRFIARENHSNGHDFHFQKVMSPGYLIRSLGFRGKSFVIVAADYEPDSTLVFMEKKIADFQRSHPSYAKLIKQFRKLLVTVLPDQPGLIRFRRGRNGIHEKISCNLKLLPTYDEKKVDILFNVYPIMMEFLKAYNHSFLPILKIEELDPKKIWQSSPLDFSENLNGVAGEVAAIIQKYIKFKQKKPFRVNYHVKGYSNSLMEIIGTATPDVKVWGKFKIRNFYRWIKVRLNDQNLVEDRFFLEIGDKNNVGGIAQASLKLVE